MRGPALVSAASTLNTLGAAGCRLALIPTTELMKQQQQRAGARLVACPGGHLFQIIDGQRRWVSEPPASYLEDVRADLERAARRAAFLGAR